MPQFQFRPPAVFALCCSLVLVLPAFGQEEAIVLSDTIAFDSRGGLQFPGQTAQFFRLASTYWHADGETLVYDPRAVVIDTRTPTGYTKFKRVTTTGPLGTELVVRDLNIIDGTDRTRLITRLFDDGRDRLAGSATWSIWPAVESRVANDIFPVLTARFYDEIGAEYAAHDIREINTDFVDILDYKVAASRYGNFCAVAMLTTRRSDRRAIQQERGATLTVVIYQADGTVIAEKTANLPDLRAAYTLHELAIDPSATAVVLLERDPFRQNPATIDAPYINEWEWVRFDRDTRQFTTIPMLPSGRQLRRHFVLDQEPSAAGFALTYSEKLSDPIEGVALALADATRSQFVPLSRTALDQLPKEALSPARATKPRLRNEFDLSEIRFGMDGALYALAENIFRPNAIQDPSLLQWRSDPDGRVEGLAMLRLGLNDDSADAGYYLPLRQDNRTGFDTLAGATLIPDGLGYSLVYNQEVELLGPLKTKRIRPTAFSFAQPILARFSPDSISQVPLEMDSPHPFLPMLHPKRSRVLPSGILAGFAPLNPAFNATEQFGLFAW